MFCLHVCLCTHACLVPAGSRRDHQIPRRGECPVALALRLGAFQGRQGQESQHPLVALIFGFVSSSVIRQSFSVISVQCEGSAWVWSSLLLSWACWSKSKNLAPCIPPQLCVLLQSSMCSACQPSGRSGSQLELGNIPLS